MGIYISLCKDLRKIVELCKRAGGFEKNWCIKCMEGPVIGREEKNMKSLRGKKLVVAILVVLLVACIPVAVFFWRHPSASPAEWAQELSEESLSVVVWDDFGEWALSDEEIRTLTTILNGLQPDAFHENKRQAGITPAFGIRLSVGDKEYYINEADSPAGQMEMGYQGKMWWIQSDSLYELVRSLHSEPSKLRTSLLPSVPAVLICLSSWRDCSEDQFMEQVPGTEFALSADFLQILTVGSIEASFVQNGSNPHNSEESCPKNRCIFSRPS